MAEKDFDWEAFRKEQAEREAKAKREREKGNEGIARTIKKKPKK